ncbi:hypothetical protein [Deinococcus peraridilitoris]|uniref:Uncharacterized protein n=1 Tax=Deinococcus peraridilitoris (strain DSM 19664 / LMG 22246 / CIP 109416 / KR-200) TaxID=937777 RepID=L0A3W8_DEIPD|nr:hypothetical protein [Deinococcus peraridilitoris]AFZ67892.1 hypothetical protein Deipe_2417 [Deinococcus peraridilitoris DSM 19664]
MATLTGQPAQYKRGKAAKDAQLSQLQRKILVWVLAEEQRLKDGSFKGRRELAKLGVPWSAKAFMRVAQLDLSRSTISESLGALVKRGLLVPAYDGAYANQPRTPGLGPNRRTSHLKLSVIGREAAVFEKEHGKTRRQVLEEAQKEYWRKRVWELRQQRAKLHETYSHGIAAFEESGGVLLDLSTGEATTQEQYEREHEQGMRWLAWELEEAVARSKGEPSPWDDLPF